MGEASPQDDPYYQTSGEGFGAEVLQKEKWVKGGHVNQEDDEKYPARLKPVIPDYDLSIFGGGVSPLAESLDRGRHYF